MKIAVLTDLHANREAVQAVLSHAQAQGAETHAFVGDYVGYGADPGWVVNLVREKVAAGAVAVMGNHDLAVAKGPSPRMRPDARRVVEWTRAQLDAEQLDFLASLPLTQTRGELLFVHANAYDPPGWDYLLGRVEAARSMLATGQRISFCGHMHEPRLYHLSELGKAAEIVLVPGEPIALLSQRNWLVVPGSAGQPRDGKPTACYALYDEERSELTCWRVPYDVSAACAKIRAAGLPPALAQRLVDGH